MNEYLSGLRDRLESHFISDSFWFAFFITLTLGHWRFFVVLTSGMDPLTKIEKGQGLLISTEGAIICVAALCVAAFRTWVWPRVSNSIEEYKLKMHESSKRRRNAIHALGSVDINQFYGAIIVAKRYKKDWENMNEAFLSVERAMHADGTLDQRMAGVELEMNLCRHLRNPVELTEKERDALGAERFFIDLAMQSKIETVGDYKLYHEATYEHAKAIKNMEPKL